MTATTPTEAPPRRLPSKRWLWWLLPLVIVLVVATALAMRNPRSETPLNPNNPGPQGARAMAQVLEREGVQVRTPESADAVAQEDIGSGTTVAVTRPNLLDVDRWDRFVRKTADADRIVLIRPGSRVLDAFGIPADTRSSTFGVESAGCSAKVARGLRIPTGERYAPLADATGVTTCFQPGGGFSAGGDEAGTVLVAAATSERPEIVVIGNDNVVRNSGVQDEDLAALGLRALGHSDHLVWWNVGRGDVDHANAPPPKWPDWLAPMWVVVGLAAILLILARGRRLGRLVTEPLPVVVRADETTRARGQLYRRAGDLERASAVLRSATRRRLTTYLQVGPDERTLVTAVASAVGRAPSEVDRLLHGPPPTTEAELSTLARHLHDLEKEIRPR